MTATDPHSVTPVRGALAIALTGTVFVVDEHLAGWFYNVWASFEAFTVGIVVLAAAVIVMTRGRVALPHPTPPWSGRAWPEVAARTFAATLLVGAVFLPLILIVERWWPDVPGTGGDAPWAPGYQAFVRAPVWEEFVWRGLLLGVLCRLVPTRVAIVLSTVAFALIHFDQGYRVGLLSTIAGGFVFALAAMRTGRLWLPIVLHSIFNNHLIAPVVFVGAAVAWGYYTVVGDPDTPKSTYREIYQWCTGQIRLWFRQLRGAATAPRWPHHLRSGDQS